MKIKDILQLDCREKENKWLLKTTLLKLPFFQKYKEVNDITFEKLELAVIKMRKKFPVVLSYIMAGPDRDGYSSFMIKREDTGEWLNTVYALSMYEGYAKSLLFLYAYCKKNFMRE